MECPFKIGDKVVCVDNHEGYGEPVPCQFQLNSIYTVDDFLVGLDAFAVLHVRIKEIPGPNMEEYWAWWRFKPLIERPKETDISVFKKLLRTTKVKEPIHAM